MWLLILEGLAIGCLLGLTGAGGGILAIPVPGRWGARTGCLQVRCAVVSERQTS